MKMGLRGVGKNFYLPTAANRLDAIEARPNMTRNETAHRTMFAVKIIYFERGSGEFNT